MSRSIQTSYEDLVFGSCSKNTDPTISLDLKLNNGPNTKYWSKNYSLSNHLSKLECRTLNGGYLIFGLTQKHGPFYYIKLYFYFKMIQLSPRTNHLALRKKYLKFKSQTWLGFEWLLYCFRCKETKIVKFKKIIWIQRIHN